MNFSGESGQCVEFFPLGLSRILKAERIEYQTNPHPGLQSVEAGADPGGMAGSYSLPTRLQVLHSGTCY